MTEEAETSATTTKAATTTRRRRSRRRRFRSTATSSSSSSATVVARGAGRRRRLLRPLLLLLGATAVVVLLATLRLEPVAAIEATFTPNPDDASEEGGSSGPLPLSQAQRDQLTQLDQAISSSGDPKAALEKIAKSNEMTPEELGGLLMRNRRDMEAAGGAGGGLGSVAGTLPRKLIGTALSILVAVGKAGRAHPRSFGLTLTALVCVLCVLRSAPRNGIVLSTSPKPFFLSSGHTTFLPPPSSYVRSYLDSESFQAARSSLPSGTKIGFSLGKKMDDDVEGADGEEEDGEEGEEEERPTVTFHEGDPSAALSVTARRFVPFDDFLPEVDENDEAPEERTNASSSELARAAASSILRSRRFSEFVPDDRDDHNDRVQFYRSRVSSSSSSSSGRPKSGRRKKKEETEGAAIVVKGWGDFGRYGVLPLRLSRDDIASEEAEDDDVEGGERSAMAVTYHTLKGGSFDGEIRFSVKETTDEERGLAVAVSVVVPKGGRKPSKRRVEELVSLLTTSIATSIQTQALQTSSRRGQSKTFQRRATKRAEERRHVRFVAERKIEEMAKDRRRRWHRRNPDAGRYRPSGHRMRSPNNC